MTTAAPRPALTIGELARRTGVAEATLRMWEARHGFPAPRRLPSGHRRYLAEDVDAVLAIRRARDAGLSLAGAIERAREARAQRRGSVFCALRERFGELQVELLDRRALLWLTWALEDELCARARRPLLLACFQRERFYRRSEARWRDLAQSARAAIVIADFEHPRPGDRWPAEISAGPRDPILREWVVICDAPEISACLAAREQPAGAVRPPATASQGPTSALLPSPAQSAQPTGALLPSPAQNAQPAGAMQQPRAGSAEPAAAGSGRCHRSSPARTRRFETICSLEPAVAREGARAFRDIAANAASPPARALEELAAELSEPPAPSAADHLRAAISIAARVALYARG
ncbi:MAG TPA: DICT sensory domain-containing protein [Solirubrobacteraceae bacterium]|nr:DICT sensory domain-containing protein [Solirubrobacteraceae bacterium]